MKKIKTEIIVYRRVLNDKRTPIAAKILLWLAISYLLLPFDLIPDFIPVLGQIDDLIIVPALFYAAILIIPGVILKNIGLSWNPLKIDIQNIAVKLSKFNSL